MQYFQSIPKEWKTQAEELRCEACGSEIDSQKDHFTLISHWKIKDDADKAQFCSLDCLQTWIQEDSLVEA